ncbi:MAG: SRPBCC family protein [Caldilineaceae bacterium]|nr:SRPBCC family protein [Caldilineaceae bacterium]
MINPQSQVSAELYIQAARAAVWQKFIRLPEWPDWQPAVQAAQWTDGGTAGGWQEGAHFQITQGQQVLHGVIRMVATESVTVWEVMDPALNAVYALHCTDQLGGCKVTLRYTVNGMRVLLFWLQRGRRQRQLSATLEALKAHVERR